MASTNTPAILTFKAEVAITKGLALKIGATREHVVLASAATDGMIGLAAGDATVVGDPIEVYMPGGGGKAKLGGTVVAGALLTAAADGRLITATATNRVVAVAEEAGVANDLIAVEVIVATA